MTPRSRSLPAVVTLVALVVAAAVIAAVIFARRSSTASPTAPDPALSPDRVVAAVLAALKHNDPATDAGLRTTFRFASPANQKVTGPEDRFVAMVKQPPYAALINHRSSRVTPIQVDDAHALLIVRVVGPDLRPAYFQWVLSRQAADGPLKDCWMTDGVSLIPPPPGADADEERL